MLKLTLFPDLLQPLKETVDVVEELRDNEVGPCIHLFLEKCELDVVIQKAVCMSIGVSYICALETSRRTR